LSNKKWGSAANDGGLGVVIHDAAE